MSTKRKESKTENNDSPGGKETHQYVVPESDILDFVGGLSVLNISAVAARFQAVADLTSDAFEERRDQLGRSDLALIKQIANEDDGERYRRIMAAIIEAVGKGRRGINAAHLTASRAVELAFRWTHDYFSALHRYRHNLRGLSLLDPSLVARRSREHQPTQPANITDRSS